MYAARFRSAIIVDMNQPETISLSHLDESGQVRMVDVGAKAVTARVAVSRARVRLGRTAFALLQGHEQGKGEVLNTARVAGILAAKRCAELIPLCHSLPLSFVGVDFSLDETASVVEITATCRSDYKTGVEMEAMTACSVAALTVYDMCKAADKGIVIEDVRLIYKAGGKSGEWRAEGEKPYAQTSKSGGATADVGTPGVESVRASQAFQAGQAAAAAHAPQSDGVTNTATTGAVNMVYFARVAELVGKRSERLPFELPTTGQELLAALVQRYPQLDPNARLQLAVNQQHAQPSVVIHAGDEVAVFEPVTGG